MLVVTQVRQMHPQGIDVSINERKKREADAKEQRELELMNESTPFSPKASGSASVNVTPVQKQLKHRLEVLRHASTSPKNKKSTKSKPNNGSDIVEKSMIELLAVEHVMRNMKSVNRADEVYLRNRALSPVKNDIKNLSPIGSPKGKNTSEVVESEVSPPIEDIYEKYKIDLSYPALVGLGPGSSYGSVGAAVMDKRKLTTKL